VILCGYSLWFITLVYYLEAVMAATVVDIDVAAAAAAAV
jgi:hypothetical protein